MCVRACVCVMAHSPYPSCQISGRITIPGAHEAISVNLPARYYRAFHAANTTSISVHSPSDGFQATISKSFVDETITLVLFSPMDDLEMSVVLQAAPKGLTD